MLRKYVTTGSLFTLVAMAALVCTITATTDAFEAKTTLTESQQRLMKDVKFLAADALKGRGIGTDGLNKAADFIRDEFKKAGLDVTQVDGGAFQKFTMVTGTDQGDDNSLQLMSADGQSIDIEYDTDYRACSFGNSGTFDTEIVFAGYGINATNPKYNDFADADIKGKAVVIIRRTPQQGVRSGPFSGRRAGQFGDLRSKIKNAVDAGAVAVLIANDPHGVRTAAVRADARMKQAAERLKRAEEELAAAGDDESKDSATNRVKLLQSRFETAKKAAEKTDHDDLMEFGYAGNANDNAIPVFHVRQTALNKLLTASIGKTLTDLESEINKSLKPATTLLTGWKAKGTASVKRIDTEVKNVIGVIEGEGDLANETVVIGAHYDHVGMGASGSLARGAGPAIHNGADDNASGTASLIEIARRIAGQPNKPKRRMVFIAFTAEESGLVGSARYCSEPVFPIEDTVAMFNMDMVGRLTGNRLTIYGTGTATGWDKRIAALGLKYQFDLGMKPEGLGPSDHASFYRKKIPALHFFTGIHPNYHRPSDDWDLVNIPGMARIVDCVEEIAMETAQAESRPEYVAVTARAKINETASRPYFGVVPDLTSDAQGLAVASVAKDGPAEKAGVKTGDVIVKFVGEAVGSLTDFDALLRKQTVDDQELVVVVKRDGNEISLKVKLSQP